MALNTEAIDADRYYPSRRKSALEQMRSGDRAEKIKKAVLEGREHEYGIVNKEAVSINQLEAYMFVHSLKMHSLYEHVLGVPSEAIANIDNISRLLPPTPGIYFICSTVLEDELSSIVYIGMTEAGFDRRLSSAHHAITKLCWDKRYKRTLLTLKYVSLYSDMDIEMIEAAAISYFEPTINVVKTFPPRGLMDNFIERARFLFNEEVE